MPDTLDKLISEAAEAWQQGRLQEARTLLLRALPMLRQEPRGAPLAQALRSLGEIERKLGIRTAREHYEESVEIFRQCDMPLALAHTVRHLGDLSREEGDLGGSDAFCREALDLYRAHSDGSSLDFANAIRSMAVLKEQTGETEESRRLWEEARAIYAKLDIAAGVKESSARLTRL